jgi:hypothetical protein
MMFQHGLYQEFARIGAVVEVGAIVAAAALAWLVRGERMRFALTLGSAVVLAAALLVVWMGFTNRANVETARWTAETIPQDWASWRTVWEYSHLTRFFLHWTAFSALLLTAFPLTAFQPVRSGRAA